MAALRTRYESRMREHQEAFQQKKSDMEKKINEMREKNAKMRAADEGEETEKARLAKRYEKEVGDVISKYDDKVRELVVSLGESQEAFKRENRRLTDLRERFDKIEEERDCIRQEDGITDARKLKLETEKQRRNEMAALVQAYWRGIVQREQYAALKKNKKKNKKGGGKKKK